MGHQRAEVGFKDAHEDPCQGDLHNNRHKEQSGGVLEAKHVDDDFRQKDDHKHKNSEEAAEREHHPETFSSSVVVSEYGFDHGKERNRHGSNNKDVEFQAKIIITIFVYKPIETHQQDSLYDQLSKGFCDCF